MPPTEQLPIVDYSPKDGALCPSCGAKMKVTNTLPWVGEARVRYHTCPSCDARATSMEGCTRKKVVDVTPGRENKGFRSNPYHPLAR